MTVLLFSTMYFMEGGIFIELASFDSWQKIFKFDKPYRTTKPNPISQN